MKLRVLCKWCDKVWGYSGKQQWACCPRCRKKTRLSFHQQATQSFDLIPGYEKEDPGFQAFIKKHKLTRKEVNEIIRERSEPLEPWKKPSRKEALEALRNRRFDF